MPSSRRASLLPRLPRRLRGCSALHATAAALEHPFHTATSTLGAPSRAMGLCLRRHQTPSYLSRRRLRFFRAFRASTAAFGHPFRTATSTLGAPSRAMAPVPSPPSNALPPFRGGGFASSTLSVHLPRRLSILSIQPPRRLALLPARWRLCLRRHQTPSRVFTAAALLLPRFPCIYRGAWASFPYSHLDAWRSFPRDGACAFAAIKRPPAFSRRRLRFFRAFRASTAAFGHPFRTATSTLGAPSRAMAPVPSPPANAFLPFAAAALLLPRFPCIYRGAWASFPYSHLDAWRSFPRDGACAFAAIKRPPAFSRRRLRGFRAFPFRRASLLPLSLSPRLLALRSPAVFPASKSRKNSGRGIDRARRRASVTGSIWLSIPRPAASKAVRGGAYRPARRRP